MREPCGAAGSKEWIQFVPSPTRYATLDASSHTAEIVDAATGSRSGSVVTAWPAGCDGSKRRIVRVERPEEPTPPNTYVIPERGLYAAAALERPSGRECG